MAIWIELRCEGRNKNADCLSNSNDGPMELSMDDQRSVLDTLRLLSRVGREAGWRRSREGWLCPKCSSRVGGSPSGSVG